MINRITRALLAAVITFVSFVIYGSLPTIYSPTLKWDDIVQTASDTTMLGLGVFCSAMVFTVVVLDPKKLREFIMNRLDYPWW